MGKIVINHSDRGVVLDVDTLARFIDEADKAAGGDADAAMVLPDSAKYVAEMLRPLLEDD